MTYPTLEQYQEALQHPQLAFHDPAFKTASIARTGLGLPLALCGGFALTYAVTSGGRKFAVRCFHKQSSGLEDRYRAISHRLGVLRSPYFLDFEFQPQGVRVGKSDFPIVKMAWASGVTLGEWLAAGHRDAAALGRLDESLRNLAGYLDANGVAHGDIQPGNVMVADDGRSVQLIDYDGMYVEQLKALGSAELGLRNFQHPLRSPSSWDTALDRFSFITISLAVRALALDPGLWSRHQADENSLLFKANDFAQPDRSPIFQELSTTPGLAGAVRDFSAICRAPYERTPTLADFLARRNIPEATFAAGPAIAPARYMSAFPVFSADYARCLRAVGDRIELVAKVTDVKRGKGINGQPYVFVNFGDWRGSIVKIAIWSDGLRALVNPPDASWVGRWVSVVGLLEPPYSRGTYRHLTVTVAQANQMHLISEQEAAFRLAGSATRSPRQPGPTNEEILKEMKAGHPAPPTRGARPAAVAPRGLPARPQPVRSQPVTPAPDARGSSAGPSWKTAIVVLVGTAIALGLLALANSPPH